MLNIMKYLNKELKKINPRVFNEDVSKDAIFPYIVFNITTSSVSEKNREDVILEIDIWDIRKDNHDVIVSVETLTNRIDKFLKENRHNDDDSVFIFQKINRLNIPDEDMNIKRRQLRYVVKYYNKNQ